MPSFYPHRSLDIPPCKKCGEETVMRKCRAVGWAEEFLYPDGETELNIENVEFRRSKKVVCAKCGTDRSDTLKYWNQV